jgi:hypothetical protein
MLQGAIETSAETMLLTETDTARLAALEGGLLALQSYQPRVSGAGCR